MIEGLIYFLPMILLVICMAGATSSNKPRVAVMLLIITVLWAIFWPVAVWLNLWFLMGN